MTTEVRVATTSLPYVKDVVRLLGGHILAERATPGAIGYTSLTIGVGGEGGEVTFQIDPAHLRALVDFNEDGADVHQWDTQRSEYLRGQVELLADSPGTTLLSGDEVFMDDQKAAITAAAEAMTEFRDRQWIKYVRVTLVPEGDPRVELLPARDA